MKKLLTILGSIILITTTSTAVIACKNINQQEVKNKETEQKDKKESIESTDDKQKERANKSENDSKPNEHPQGDQPHNAQPSDLPRKNNEELVKNNKMNFDLIKKYGKEFIDLLTSLGEKAEKISEDPENIKVLTLARELSKAYEDLKKYSNFDTFQSELKQKLNKSETELSDFISNLEKYWNKIVKDYENEREKILKVLEEKGK
ncbi:lipoprotein [Mycoplasma mycoides]|uniref:Lipoprotein n=1 Tax=Mycoplasma mycoides subsp. capri TaxID=40477 RepID=A0AB38GDK2_MYCMC|nr:lipoprotein [Mycoplasma mycoides]ADH22204.1 putative liporotein [synthetic Mycoplasma mycoides JCVI-syn1.0]ACU78466.1 putative liporotein [Mycoplasma mycoides subsp. capri str. GM12]ACU79296.1 putative liporotein [Mycoplasma mycoides subsp. capri str. GM12]SRX58629.1 putative lipoprotein [Mycoplasma mycoides subsp. capri]SRX61191.1 putative lipoprotein [Mycoplasma mycoides subsp. capri]